MIAWCGSRADGLGWLGDRCSSIDDVEISESICLKSIDLLCTRNPRRLILAVENRLAYPLAEIQHLQRNWPEIPLALAVGTWFDGSRRTGIGVTCHLSLPWYRWWDGWQPWLSVGNAELLNSWPKAAIRRAAHRAGGSSGVAGIVLSNCQQTAEGWRIGLGCAPESSRWLRLAEFQTRFSQADLPAPDWILWDDSCLDTLGGADSISDVGRLFADIREGFPGALILAATCMPRWCDWRQWELAGADQLLAKPTSGVLLWEIIQVADSRL
jgi:hypothetical protein